MPPASQHQLHRGPSRTAVLTAVARALHREEPQPWVMDDDLAPGLAGREGRALLGRLRAKAPRPYLLAFSRWTAALAMMALADVLTRLVVVFLRGHRLTAGAAPVIAPPVQAGAAA
jgi:O-methyltransferase involved in polyketide biosynthesis